MTPGFVQRMYNSTSPAIQNPNGTVSTHKMEYASDERGFFVYPTIIERNSRLEELSREEAVKYAYQTGGLKRFKTQEEAKRFAAGSWKNDVVEQKKQAQEMLMKILLAMKI